MPRKNHEYSRTNGVRQLEKYLLEHSQPMRRSELARIFGCHKATMGRWIDELEADGVPIEWDAQERLWINRNTYFTSVRLSRDESLMTMIALRLMQQHMQHTSQHTVETMHKIGLALRQGLAPQVGEYILQQTRHQREQMNPSKIDSQRCLERIGEAWLNSRKISWRYRPLHARNSFEEVFHPYMIEPIAAGGSTYIIGFSETAKAIRTRKLERIERLPILLDETFTVQADFDPIVLLKGAWGIWFAPNEPPVTVTLRFNRHAKQRLMETRWHPSQTTQEDDQGNIIWQAVVDEWKPLVPWVRSWGADCEVLKPAELRNEVLASLRRAMNVYGLQQPSSNDPDDELLRTIFGG